RIGSAKFSSRSTKNRSASEIQMNLERFQRGREREFQKKFEYQRKSSADRFLVRRIAIKSHTVRDPHYQRAALQEIHIARATLLKSFATKEIHLAREHTSEWHLQKDLHFQRPALPLLHYQSLSAACSK